MKILTILTTLLLFSCASTPFENWTTADSVREITYQSLNIIDYYQTKEILENPEYNELNPLVDDPDIFCLCVGLGHLLISGLVDDEYRDIWQWVTIGTKAGAVGNNYFIGVRF